MNLLLSITLFDVGGGGVDQSPGIDYEEERGRREGVLDREDDQNDRMGYGTGLGVGTPDPVARATERVHSRRRDQVNDTFDPLFLGSLRVRVVDTRLV